MTFESQNVILYVPRMFLSDVDDTANICSGRSRVYVCTNLCIHVCGSSIVGSRKRNRFSRGAIFLFYKAPRRNRYVPPKTGPFFQMVKISLFFLDIERIYALVLSIYTRKLEFEN